MDRSDRERVRASAQLARLALGEPRAAQLAGELDEILDHFRVLARVDVEGVEPLVRPEVEGDGPRRDEPRPSLPREALLAAAPDPRGEFYGVPLTIDPGAADGERA